MINETTDVEMDVHRRVRQALHLVEQAYEMAGVAQGLLAPITGPGACEAYEQLRDARAPLYEQIKALQRLQHRPAREGWGLDEDGRAELGRGR